MKLKNVLIVTENMERSKKFYKDLFGLEVILDNIGKEVVYQNNACELYFEEKDLEKFVEKLNQYEMPIVYVNPLMQHSWGQSVVRFYDPDGNLIEVGTPM